MGAIFQFNMLTISMGQYPQSGTWVQNLVFFWPCHLHPMLSVSTMGVVQGYIPVINITSCLKDERGAGAQLSHACHH